MLNEHCLYYFKTQPGTGPRSKGKENCRCIIPLENCKVVETPEGPLTFALRSSNPFGDQVKSAKRMKNGSLIQGKHKEYVFKAESFEKEAMWVKALKNEVTDNPLLDTLAERRAKARGELSYAGDRGGDRGEIVRVAGALVVVARARVACTAKAGAADFVGVPASRVAD